MSALTSSPKPCVGRDPELASLNAQLDKAQHHLGSICIVKGGTGSGKSTLLREFIATVERAESDVVVAWGHCDPQTGSLRPLLPWTNILESLAGVSEVVVPNEQVKDRKRVLDTARSTFAELAPDIVELLLPGVGLVIRSAKLISTKTSLGRRLTGRQYSKDTAPAEADRTQLEDQYVTLMERVLDDSPLVLVIDDLHCADVASLDLLRRLSRKTGSRPLLILAAIQDQSREIKHEETTLEKTLSTICNDLDATTLDLDLAMRQRGDQLVDAYVGAVVPGVGEQFVAELTTHTGGHPLFVVELIDHLLHTDKIRKVNGTWREAADISWSTLPNRVENVLDAQLAELEDEVREVLRTASVEGDQFTVEVIAGVMDETPMAIARLLSRRAPKNLIEPLGNFTIAGRRITRFRFCHSLARQHTYASVEQVERPYLHEAIAEQYETVVEEQPGPLAAQLAFHYDQAKLGERARTFYAHAADYAVSTGSLIEATAHLERALALSTRNIDQMTLSTELAKVLAMTGRVNDAAPLYERAVTIAESANDTLLADILVNQSFTLTRLHEFDAAFAAAAKALDLTDSSEDVGLRIAAFEALSHVTTKRGEHQQSLDYAEAGLRCCADFGDDDLRGGVLFRRGWAQKELGRYDEAQSSLDESLTIQTVDRPNWSGLAATHNALADLYISVENYPQARANLERAIDAWRKFDQHSDVAVALGNLANLANREHLYAQALSYGLDACAIDVEVLGEDHPELAFALTCIGESHIGLEDYDSAIEVLTRANALRTAHEVPEGNRAWTRWLLGRTLADSHRDTTRGMALVVEARAVFQSMGSAAASELKDVNDWLHDRGSTST